MLVQKFIHLNFEKIIIIIFFSESMSQNTQKNEFQQNWTMSWSPTTHSNIRMFLNGIKIQLELI